MGIDARVSQWECVLVLQAAGGWGLAAAGFELADVMLSITLRRRRGSSCRG